MRIRRVLMALVALVAVLAPAGVAIATSGSVSLADNGVINSHN